MSPRLHPLLACAALAAPLSGVDWTSATFGDQPVAIGAGPRALGMGGAFSAVADDATAATWNPAGLTQCERPELAASLGWYHSRIDSGTGQVDSDEELQADHVSVMAPFHILGCQQVIGLAWQRQFDFTRELSLHSISTDPDPFLTITNEDTRQISRSGSYASLGLSYAIEVHPGVSFGFTLNQWSDRISQASSQRQDSHLESVTTATFGFPGFPPLVERNVFDIHETSRVTSGTSVVLGSWWQALPELTVAAVAKPGYHLKLATDRNIQQTTYDPFGGVTANDLSASSESTVHYPPSATLGLAWRHDDLHTVSFDATWTRWSDYYVDDASGRRSPVSYYLPPEDFDDLWSLRLGYEYIAILSSVVLVPRVGALYEELPAVTQATSLTTASEVSATRDRWYGLTTGLSICQRRIIWDAAVQVRQAQDVGSGQFTDPNHTADLTLITVRAGATLQF